jgi:hypothetical protein
MLPEATDSPTPAVRREAEEDWGPAHVPLDEGYVKATRGSIPTRYIEKIGRAIEAGDVGTPFSQGIADAAMTATEIEHSRTWLQRGEFPYRVRLALGTLSSQ